MIRATLVVVMIALTSYYGLSKKTLDGCPVTVKLHQVSGYFYEMLANRAKMMCSFRGQCLAEINYRDHTATCSEIPND